MDFLSRKNSLNPIEIIMEFLRMFLILRTIKPKIVHSHTLKANLIVTICCSLLGLPCVLSFAGLGRLINTKKNFFLYSILRFIYFFGNIERVGFFSFAFNNKRTQYIFQNAKDKKVFDKVCKPNPNQTSLIWGSGVPSIFLKKINKNKIKIAPRNIEINKKIKGCIYCGRLLKSKGINLFVNLARIDSSRKYYVFGGIDESSSDSLTNQDILNYKSIKNLEFRGVVKNPILKFFKKPYVLIVPSMYGEGMPRAIAEALILEIPVLCSIESMSEIFTNEIVNVVKNHDPQEYLKNINLLENKFKNKKYKERLNRGKEFVLNHLTEEIVILKTLKIYKKFENLSKDIFIHKVYNENSDNWISN